MPTATGNYSGQVKISNPSNANDFVTINISLAVNGGSAPAAQRDSHHLDLQHSCRRGAGTQYVQITLPSSSTRSRPPFRSGAVRCLSPRRANGCTYSGSQNLAVSVSPGSLGAGTYVNYITLTSGGVNFATITVTLVVGGGGTTTGGIAAPTSLSFYYETGQASPPAQVVTIAATGSLHSQPEPELDRLEYQQRHRSRQPDRQRDPAGIFRGHSTSGTINITTPSGGQTINVSLTVTSGMVLYANPGTINLTTPNYQSILQITASDNSAQAVTATTSTSWITLSSPTNEGNTPTSYLVTVNPATLCNGLNTGSITATASGASNSPLTIPVTVLVSGSSVTSCSNNSTGPLTLSPSSLTFAGGVNGSAPPTQTLIVTAPSSSTFYIVSTSVSTSTNWLSVTSACSTYCYGSQSFVVSVNQSGLSAGTYQGTISFNTNGTVQQVGVTLNVGTSGGTGTITASSNSLSFTAAVNGSAPAAQNVQFTSSAAGVGYVLTYTPARQLAVGK